MVSWLLVNHELNELFAVRHDHAQCLLVNEELGNRMGTTSVIGKYKWENNCHCDIQYERGKPPHHQIRNRHLKGVQAHLDAAHFSLVEVASFEHERLLVLLRTR